MYPPCSISSLNSRRGLVAVSWMLASVVAACGTSDTGGEAGDDDGSGATGGGGSGLCGDGIINGEWERCDENDLGGATCTGIIGTGWAGPLGCTKKCDYDTSACTRMGDGGVAGAAGTAGAAGAAGAAGIAGAAGTNPDPVCGDDSINQAGEECDGTDFGGATCSSRLGIAATGNLACNECIIDTSGCSYCGDGVLDPGEQCDGSQALYETCEELLGPQSSGTLQCDSDCEIVATDCSPAGFPPSCSEDPRCQGKSCCLSTIIPSGSFQMGHNEPGDGGDAPPAAACGTGYPFSRPEHIQTVSEFRLDVYEVTVSRFRKFVEQYSGPPGHGDGAHPRIPGTGWNSAWDTAMPATQAELMAHIKCSPPTGETVNGTPPPQGTPTWTDDPGSNESAPMNCVLWYEAFAFCLWDGGWLPTEAEWEYAAAGGDEDRIFPWGDDIPTAHANTLNMFPVPTPFVDVGSFPDGESRWGQQDMGGSMLEWTLDVYLPNAYCDGVNNPEMTNGGLECLAEVPAALCTSCCSGDFCTASSNLGCPVPPAPCIEDCTQLTPALIYGEGGHHGVSHMLRGGSWREYFCNTRAAHRRNRNYNYDWSDSGTVEPPWGWADRLDEYGFRCARLP